MDNIKEFSEMLADSMQGIFLLTPNEIDKIIGKRALDSFEKGILVPLMKDGVDESEIFEDFVDV